MNAYGICMEEGEKKKDIVLQIKNIVSWKKINNLIFNV